MTRDDTIRLAKDAKLPMAWIKESGVITWSELERFATLVAAAEREACAEVCQEDGLLWGQRYADAIRARGET